MQMVSDVPIGAFLSGGIDSSAVVALHGAAQRPAVKTYAIGFDGGAADAYYNELPYARQVARAVRHRPPRDRRAARTSSSLLPQLLWHMDEPIADTAFITTYLVSEFARRDVTVILSGVGGDELFGGYRRYLGSHYQALLRPPAARAAPRRRRRSASACRATGTRRCSTRCGWRRGSSRAPACRSRSATAPTSRCSPTSAARSCCAPTRGDDADRARRGVRVAHAATTTLNRMLAVDAETQLPDDLLLLTDKMSMAVSLECRVPLLDHELVELAARMPEASRSAAGG